MSILRIEKVANGFVIFNVDIPRDTRNIIAVFHILDELLKFVREYYTLEEQAQEKEVEGPLETIPRLTPIDKLPYGLCAYKMIDGELIECRGKLYRLSEPGKSVE